MPNPLVMLGGSGVLPQREPTPFEQKIVRAKILRVAEDGTASAVLHSFSRIYEFDALNVGAGLEPQAGEECVIVFDNENRGTVIWTGEG